VAYAGSDRGLDPADVEGHARLAAGMQVVFGVGPDGSEQVTLEARDVTRAIRTEAAGQGASRVAVWPAVRTALLARQRAFARPPGLVADGRDMGTVIFPQARLKIYLTASAAERALRRYKQLKDKGSGASLSALSREITERDARDSTRAVAPLIPASDAEVIDSTGLTIEEVVDRVLELGVQRSLWPAPRA
jgi:cytidylate kinase